MLFQTIPVLRIFDVEKAKAFYLDFLGMKMDWEHRFGADYPVYMQVSRGDLVFHLSEHSGDGTPGTKLFVNTADLDGVYQDIMSKGYRYCRPEISVAPWDSRVFEVVDPFSNRILFSEG